MASRAHRSILLRTTRADCAAVCTCRCIMLEAFALFSISLRESESCRRHTARFFDYFTPNLQICFLSAVPSCDSFIYTLQLFIDNRAHYRSHVPKLPFAAVHAFSFRAMTQVSHFVHCLCAVFVCLDSNAERPGIAKTP